MLVENGRIDCLSPRDLSLGAVGAKQVPRIRASGGAIDGGGRGGQ